MGKFVLVLLMMFWSSSAALAIGDLFYEDFNDGTADGFEADCPLWTVTPEGTYHIENLGYEVYCWSFAGNSGWTDYTYSFDLRSHASVNQMAAFRVQDNGDCYVVNLRSDPWNDAWLTKWVNGVPNHRFSTPINNFNDEWHSLKVSVAGPRIQFDVDGQEVFTFVDTYSPFLSGRIGVVSYTGGVAQKQTLDIDNLSVDSLVVGVTPSTLSQVKSLFR